MALWAGESIASILVPEESKVGIKGIVKKLRNMPEKYNACETKRNTWDRDFCCNKWFQNSANFLQGRSDLLKNSE